MTKPLSATAWDLEALPEVIASHLGRRIAKSLERGEYKAVPDLLSAATPGRDRYAILAMRATIKLRLTPRDGVKTTPQETLRLTNALAALSPDAAEPLLALCNAARHAGEAEQLEELLVTFAARFPGAPGLERLTGRFRAELVRNLEADGANVARLATWLAAAGRLDPPLYPAVIAALRAQKINRPRIAHLVALCPRLTEPPEAQDVARRWHHEALNLAPALARSELARVAPLRPAELMLTDMLTLSLATRRSPEPALLDQLRACATSPPEDLARRAEYRWRAQLDALSAKGDMQAAYACFAGLEALGVTRPTDLLVAVGVLDDIADPEGRLPALLERCRQAGITQITRVHTWQVELRKAMRRKDIAAAWDYGRRLRGIGAAGKEFITAMLKMTRQLAVPKEVIFDLVEELIQADPEARRELFTPATCRDVVEAGLALMESGALDRAFAVLGWLIDHASPRAAPLDRMGEILAALPDADVTAALERLSEQHPAAADYFAAVVALRAGEQTQAARRFEAALAAGLKGELADIAMLELKAASFQLVSAEEFEGEPAIVLVEPGANVTLIGQAPRLSPSVHVCSANYVDTDTEDGNSVTEIGFQIVDVPEVSEACDALSIWAMRALEQEARRLGLIALLPVRYREYVRRYLARRLYATLRAAYNFRKAIAASGVRRAFFAVRAGQASRIVACGLLAEGGFEVRVANGSPSPRARRHVLPGSIATPVAQREAVSLPQHIANESFTWKLPRFPDRKGLGADPRPHLLVVVTSSRPDIIAPVPDLVAALHDQWKPVVIFFDRQNDAEQMRTSLARHPVAQVAETPFHVVPIRELWAESRYVQDCVELRQAAAAVDPAASRMQHAGMLLGTDVVDVLENVDAAAGVALRLDRWTRLITRDLKPAAALFTHSAAMEPSVVCAALATVGVPTFWLQLLQHPRDRTFMRPPAAHHLVLDRYSADLWADFIGVPPEQTTVVGSLRISAVINRVRGITREDARGVLGVASDEKLVVIATQPVPAAENIVLIKNVIEAVRDTPGIRLLVKMHPAEREERIAGYARSLAGTPLEHLSEISRSRDIYGAIIASDLVVIQHSNVGIEALMMDRAALAIVLGGKIGTFSIVEHGVEEAKAGPEAIQRIRALLTDPAARAQADAARRALLDAQPEMHDGCVPERIARRIAEVIAAPTEAT